MTEHRGTHLLLVSLLAFLSGCAAASKRLATIESALGDPSALAKLCEAEGPAACALLGREARAERAIPLMQSVTSAVQARIVAVVPVDSKLSYFITGPQPPRKLESRALTFKESSDEVNQIEAFGLKPGEDYELVAIDPHGRLWDRRKFRALDLKKKNARLLLVSCMDDSLEDVQQAVWPEALAHRPDAIVMLGDNVYADKVDGRRRDVTEPLQLWRRYAETRKRLALFRANPLVPVVATWDDHDYGKNDSDRTFAFKDRSAEIFLSYFQQSRPAPGFERGPGVASWWRAFGLHIALLDDRSFRSPNGLDLADQTHFGAEQENWLREGLAGAPGPVLLASGDQFFGGYHAFESFQGSHPKSFKMQIERWRRTTRRPVLFLSGDRHLTEIIKVPKEHLGFATYEITSSGVHARVFADAFDRAPNPHQLAGRAGEYNYTLIQVDEAAPNRLGLRVTAYAPGGKTLYQHKLTVNR